MKIEFSSQRREMLLFLTTNMAAVTSRANHQWMNKDLRHNVYRFHSLIMVSRSQFRSVSDAFGEFAWR